LAGGIFRPATYHLSLTMKIILPLQSFHDSVVRKFSTVASGVGLGSRAMARASPRR